MKNKQLENRPDSTLLHPVKTKVFGINITNEKQEYVLEFLLEVLRKKKEKVSIVTPNPEMVVYAQNHPAFKKILNEATLALCDGMQLFRAARLIGKPLKQRITGVTFMEMLCQLVSRKPITVGFLGGRNGVAKIVADRLSIKYPGLRVEFFGEEPSELVNYKFQITNVTEKGHKEVIHVNSKLDQKYPKHIDILFVAFGFPKQEEWMFTNLSKLNVTVMMGVGGAFDYLSERVHRAPLFVQNLGFEWLYRLILQPWRWKRQLALIEFMWLVILDKCKRE